MRFLTLVAGAATLLEFAGVVTMVFGALWSLLRAAGVLRSKGGADAFRTFRQDLGRAILLGLEFLVAADIVKTVIEAPSLRNVVVLGMVVLIRTFLSFTLQVELDGRWPWQKKG